MDSDRISSFSYADCHNDDKKLGVRFSLCLKILPDSTLSPSMWIYPQSLGVLYYLPSKLQSRGLPARLWLNFVPPSAQPFPVQCLRLGGASISSSPTLALVPQLIWALELSGQLVLS